MSIKLFENQGCNCEFEMIINKVKNSKVKGYEKVNECDMCKTKREADAQLSAEKQIEEEKEIKIRKEMDSILRQQAIDNLTSRGEL